MVIPPTSSRNEILKKHEGGQEISLAGDHDMGCKTCGNMEDPTLTPTGIS